MPDRKQNLKQVGSQVKAFPVNMVKGMSMGNVCLSCHGVVCGCLPSLSGDCSGVMFAFPAMGSSVSAYLPCQDIVQGNGCLSYHGVVCECL